MHNVIFITIRTFEEYAKSFFDKNYSKEIVKSFLVDVSKIKELRDPFYIGMMMEKNNTIIYSFVKAAIGDKK